MRDLRYVCATHATGTRTHTYAYRTWERMVNLAARTHPFNILTNWEDYRVDVNKLGGCQWCNIPARIIAHTDFQTTKTEGMSVSISPLEYEMHILIHLRIDQIVISIIRRPIHIKRFLSSLTENNTCKKNTVNRISIKKFHHSSADNLPWDYSLKNEDSIYREYTKEILERDLSAIMRQEGLIRNIFMYRKARLGLYTT